MNNNKNIRPAYDYLRYLNATIKDENFVGRIAAKIINPLDSKEKNNFNAVILVLYMDKNYVVFTYNYQDKEAKVLERENFEDWCLTQKQMISLEEAKKISTKFINELQEKFKKRGRR